MSGREECTPAFAQHDITQWPDLLLLMGVLDRAGGAYHGINEQDAGRQVLEVDVTDSIA
jgi:hypothetical protein